MQANGNGWHEGVIWRAATGGRPYGMIGMQEKGRGKRRPYEDGRVKTRPYILGRPSAYISLPSPVRR